MGFSPARPPVRPPERRVRGAAAFLRENPGFSKTGVAGRPLKGRLMAVVGVGDGGGRAEGW